jgi:hypothetical protein
MTLTTPTAPTAAGPPAPQLDLAAIERVVMTGDLSRLTDDERRCYVRQLCDAIGLNPLTTPFIYLTDKKGKLVVYPTKDCGAQLRRLYNLSLEVLEEKVVNGAVVVRVRASMPGSGGKTTRIDDDIGAVKLEGGTEDYANALMKATTKAKRRATLSVCGLGFLDLDEQAERQMDAPPPVQVEAPAAAPALPDRRNAAVVGAAVESLVVELPANQRATEAQLLELVRLRSDLAISKPDWATILHKRGVTTARNLSPVQAAELIEKLKHRVATATLEAGKDDPDAADAADAARAVAVWEETDKASKEDGASAAPESFPF